MTQGQSGETSQELYHYQEAVSQLEEAEEQLLEEHRANIEVTRDVSNKIVNQFTQSDSLSIKAHR